MGSALTRFGEYCRNLRAERSKCMGDQSEALGYPVSVISAIETGAVPLPPDYVQRLAEWLGLSAQQKADLNKRIRNNVVQFRTRYSTSNSSNSMRLFRKISKMDPAQIREFREKLDGEVRHDR